MADNFPQVQSTRQDLTVKNIAAALVGIAILTGLYFLSRSNYLFFHSLAEIFSIVIAFSIFTIAWNSRRMSDNYYFLFIGIAYLFIGGLDLIHTLAFKGMGIFPGFETNPATQLWIAARYMESLSLLLAVLFIRRKFNPSAVFYSYLLVTGLILASVIQWGIFPQAFVEGAGLTPFKVISEYIISVMLLLSIMFLIKYRREFGSKIIKLLVAALAITIASEMTFTLYTDAYGIANAAGHMLKIVSFFLIYKALIETGLSKPYELLFFKLKKSEQGITRHAATLKEVNEHLAQEISERQRVEKELRRYMSQLEATNEELESFSYSVSHDLKAPLRSLDGFSSAILEDYTDKLDEQGKEYLNHIRSSSHLMSQLIDDILNLSRIIRTEINLEEINLSQLAEEVASDLLRLHPERQVKFVIQPGLKALGDSRLLKLVFENLMGNAFKFTAKIPLAEIEFGTRDNDGNPEFFIRDNGAGFDMAYADKLFKPFQRLHSARDYPGTGIGLASVLRIIHRLGGKVRAVGETGKGAAFYFSLQKL